MKIVHSWLAELVDLGDRSTDEIADAIGVDSLGYISLDGMLGAVPDGPHGFCHACFSGQYPTQPPSVASKMRLGGRA